MNLLFLNVLVVGVVGVVICGIKVPIPFWPAPLKNVANKNKWHHGVKY